MLCLVFLVVFLVLYTTVWTYIKKLLDSKKENTTIQPQPSVTPSEKE
jgi:hypothetical protein